MLQAMTRENDVKAKQPSTSAEQMEDLGLGALLTRYVLTAPLDTLLPLGEGTGMRERHSERN